MAVLDRLFEPVDAEYLVVFVGFLDEAIRIQDHDVAFVQVRASVFETRVLEGTHDQSPRVQIDRLAGLPAQQGRRMAGIAIHEGHFLHVGYPVEQGREPVGGGDFVQHLVYVADHVTRKIYVVIGVFVERSVQRSHGQRGGYALADHVSHGHAQLLVGKGDEIVEVAPDFPARFAVHRQGQSGHVGHGARQQGALNLPGDFQFPIQQPAPPGVIEQAGVLYGDTRLGGKGFEQGLGFLVIGVRPVVLNVEDPDDLAAGEHGNGHFGLCIRPVLHVPVVQGDVGHDDRPARLGGGTADAFAHLEVDRVPVGGVPPDGAFDDRVLVIVQQDDGRRVVGYDGLQRIDDQIQHLVQVQRTADLLAHFVQRGAMQHFLSGQLEMEKPRDGIARVSRQGNGHFQPFGIEWALIRRHDREHDAVKPVIDLVMEQHGLAGRGFQV